MPATYAEVRSRVQALDPTVGAARRRALAEFAAAAGGLLVWIACKPYAWSSWVITALIVGWGSYLAWRLARDPSEWTRWGLGRQGLRRAAVACTWVTLVGLVLVAAYGVAVGPPAWPRLHPLSFILYPFWALAQEFAVQVIFVTGLVAAGVPRTFIPFVSALAFAAGHLPHYAMGALAGCGGLAWTSIWLRYRSLWPIVVSHAILGGVALVVVLGHDPVGGYFGLIPDR